MRDRRAWGQRWGLIRLCKSSVGCKSPNGCIMQILATCTTTTWDAKDQQIENTFLKRLLESWEMKKVAPPILFWCSLSAAAKNTRSSLASSMRGENAAKGDFQISGSTWPPDSHASKTPEGAIWATNHLANKWRANKNPQGSPNYWGGIIMDWNSASTRADTDPIQANLCTKDWQTGDTANDTKTLWHRL